MLQHSEKMRTVRLKSTLYQKNPPIPPIECCCLLINNKLPIGMLSKIQQ